ncbi:bifunctional diguanylate cyclase/phosphodiesterase [Marinobacterium lutimaris]|uniref:Diguanylate cyclase/phosphodiesterase n=1 Tax=Marinobacterium lutimaris TaxID=568106 RepID=A0A1H5UL98_9GAMM|nr:EAL domain-containing protein [Marinobacterium lutimaris]SEF75810.1 diguanylate cyclase/phosphodiesterase [Marinobacterium lutimaris]
MSLVKQLIAAVLAVLIGLASGTLFVMSNSGKSMLLRQLESHALDSATHLGLYISPYMAAQDTATIETAVNAIFDSGFYQRIAVMNASGEPLYVKETPPDISASVPGWFVSLVHIDPPSMERPITHQWRHVGTIYVQSSAGYAYERFWEGAQRALLLFAVLALLAALIIALLLRYLLKPLGEVERQAEALARKTYIEQPQLPKTRELRSVVQAMNAMVRQVQQMFEEQARNIEELRSIAYRDPLTGLLNQRACNAQLQARLEYERDFGPATLVLIRLRPLSEINRRCGEDSTNRLLKLVADELQTLANATTSNSLVGRLGGSEFLLLTEQQPMKLLAPQLNQLQTKTETELASLYRDGSAPAHPLIAGISQTSDQSSAALLMSEARLALNHAEEHNEAIYEYSGEAPRENLSQSWQQHVASAIRNGQVFLQYQSVIGGDQQQIHGELLARILDEDNEPCPAGRFIGVARELGLLDAMDRATLSTALDYVRRHPEGVRIAVNLGVDSITAQDFPRWLGEQIQQLSTPERVSFEINETVILNNLEQVQALRAQIQALGACFGVDNFGIHPRGFSYLYNLKPDYLKIDGSLIRDIDTSDEDRFFVRSLIGVAHNIDVPAYAEHVERSTQLDTLIALGIDGTQGYLHGRPTALN